MQPLSRSRDGHNRRMYLGDPEPPDALRASASVREAFAVPGATAQPLRISSPMLKRYCGYVSGTPRICGTGKAMLSGFTMRKNVRESFHSTPAGLNPA